MCMYICIYVYMYIDREREREREEKCCPYIRQVFTDGVGNPRPQPQP